jgi:hypothetical protein
MWSEYLCRERERSRQTEREKERERHTLQCGSAPVMMSSASSSSMRTVWPVRACLALTANLVIRPLMRSGRSQVTTTNVWFSANAVRLVTRPGADKGLQLSVCVSVCVFVCYLWIPTSLSSFDVQRLAIGSNTSRVFCCNLDTERQRERDRETERERESERERVLIIITNSGLSRQIFTMLISTSGQGRLLMQQSHNTRQADIHTDYRDIHSTL